MGKNPIQNQNKPKGKMTGLWVKNWSDDICVEVLLKSWGISDPPFVTSLGVKSTWKRSQWGVTVDDASQGLCISELMINISCWLPASIFKLFILIPRTIYCVPSHPKRVTALIMQECRLFEIDLPNTVLNFFTLVLNYTAHTALSLILLDCKGCMCVKLKYFT